MGDEHEIHERMRKGYKLSLACTLTPHFTFQFWILPIQQQIKI